MKKIILLSVGILLSTISQQQLHAFSGDYIKGDYNTVTYSTRCRQSKSQKAIFQVGFKALTSVMNKFKNNLFPKGLDNDKILEEMIIASTNSHSMDKAFKTIDTWVSSYQEQNNDALNFFDQDYLPRAYMVFVGGEKSIGIGKVVGGSANLVLIIVPECSTTWNKTTGKIIKESILDLTKFKLAINPSGGAGKKIGVNFGQTRIGVGVILDPSRELNKPKDFMGSVGGSVSKSNVLAKIAGSYVKSGITWNGFNFFPFLMGGKAFGVGQEISRNYGVTFFIPLDSVLNIAMNLSKNKIVEINNEVKAVAEENIKELIKPSSNNKTGNN